MNIHPERAFLLLKRAKRETHNQHSNKECTVCIRQQLRKTLCLGRERKTSKTLFLVVKNLS